MLLQGSNAATPPAASPPPPVGPPAGSAGSAAGTPSLANRWIDELFAGSTLDPRLQALVIVLTACAVAVVANWILTRVVRHLAARTKLSVDDQIVELMHKPLVRSTIVIGFAFALRPLAIGDSFVMGAQRVLFTLAIVVWIPFAFRASSLILHVASNDPHHFRAVERRTYPVFNNLAKLVLFAAFAYWILIVTWDVDPAGFLASAGIAGLAVGFAAQDTLSNLFAGVFIIADAPYRVGDFITLDSGERGEVRFIGLRSTRLLTRDDIEISIPNSVMGAAKITNESGGPSPKHRIHVAVSAAYGSDVDQVREVLLAVAAADKGIAADPEPRVRFRALGDSGLEFELLVWIATPSERGMTLDRLYTNVYKGFREHGIEIPYPKRDVYLHRVPEDA